MKKILMYFLIFIMCVVDIYYIFTNLMFLNIERITTFLVLFPCLLVPYTLELLLKKEIDEKYKLIYYVFIFLAQFLGSVVNLYSKIWWFDDFTHYLSGLLTGYLGYKIFKSLSNSNNTFFYLTYIIGFSFTIAGLWEIFEYSIDIVFKSNLQHAIETGVNDTMIDNLAALLGCLTFILFNRIKKSPTK